MVSRRTLRSVVLAALLVGSAVAVGTAAGAPRPTADRATTAGTVHDHAQSASPSPVTAPNATAQDAADIGTWTAPAADFEDLDDREAVREAIRTGSLTRDDTVAERDVAVLAVPASGAFGALDRQKDDEPYADAFVDLVGREGFRFHLNETNPAPNLAPARLDLAATNENDGLRVVPDERNGTLLVALKTDRLVLDRPDRGGVRVRPGQEYEANFTIAESVGLSGGRRTALGTVEIVERTVTFDTGRADVFEWTPGCNRISGETTVAPGSELALVVSGENYPLVRTRTLAVAADGTFATSFDHAGFDPNQRFVANVRGFPDSETPGVVGVGELEQVRIAEQSTDGRTVTVSSTTFSGGGFVALYPADALDELGSRRTPTDDCPTFRYDAENATISRLGVSGYLDAGQSTNVTVRLDDPLSESRTLVAVLHADTDGDRRFDPRGDRPYTVNGSAVSAAALVSLAANDTTPTTTPPTADSPTISTTPPTTVSPHPPDTPNPETATGAATTTADGPGFGPLAALLAALLALVALTRRRL